MANIDRGFSVDILVLGDFDDDQILLAQGDFDPGVIGYEAPEGSIFYRRDVPTVYLKTGPADTAWSSISAGGTDELVKVSNSDPTAGFLADKLLSGSGITVTQNAGDLTLDFTGVPRVQTVYVGKHGDDLNNGLSPELPKLTFGAAITTASGLTPSPTNKISIICEDGGTYTESFTIPSNVLIKAPNASFVGNYVLEDFAEFVFQEVSNTTGNVIAKAGTSSDAAWVTGEIVRSTGTANSIVNVASTSVFIVRVRQIFTENGTGLLDLSTGTGHIHMDVEDMYITGTGTAVDRQSNSGIIVGRISHIIEIGGGIGNGTALDITDGRMTLNVGTIETTTAYNVAGTGTLNLFVNEINEASARIQTSGLAEVNVIEADSLRWRNRQSNFTARRTEFVAIDTSGAPITMNLPNPASNGDSITFQDALNTFGTNSLTIDAGTGFLIDDGASGSQVIVLDVSGTAGVLIYNELQGLWTFSRIQEEVAFSPSNVIYVTKNGSDTVGDGSFSNPYLTINKGITEALAVASPTNPTTVKVLDGIYDEINPISISGPNSEFVQLQGSETQSTIVRPTVNGQPLFVMTSNIETGGPAISRFTMQGQNNGGTDYKDVAGGSLIQLSGNGTFTLNQVDPIDGNIGIEAGAGVVTTSQTVNWDVGTAVGSDINLWASDGVRVVGNVVNFADPGTANITANDTSIISISNYEIDGDITQVTQNGIGVVANNASDVILNGGLISSSVTGIQVNDTADVRVLATEFRNNTNDFDQASATASLQIQGQLSKTKQLITDGTNVSLNYIDTDTGDFVVGNADATATPGKEFRVRDFDGRIAVGDNATNANIATGGIGGSRSFNLIDTNGNIRVWRFVDVDGQDPAVEFIKGINPANPDAFGDAPITAITAATDTITIDVSDTDFGDPLLDAGIDRTTLAERAFPAGRDIRVNGTGANDADYVVASATYNSGPQTIDVVVTADILVDTGTVGELVFGGGAGRDDGVSTFVGDPGAAVAAGAGNVWWDWFLQEDDYFVVRRRTGGGGGIENEKMRVFPDRVEFLGSTLYDDSDNAGILTLQTVASAENSLTITNNVSGAGPVISTSGPDANINIQMIPSGTGTVTVPAGYENNIGSNSLITDAYAVLNYATTAEVDNIESGSGGIFDTAGNYDGPIVDGILNTVTGSTDLLNALSQMETALTPLVFQSHNGPASQTYTAATTILFPTNVRTDSPYTYNAGEVTVSQDGWYKVTYEITADNGANGRRTGTHLLEVNATTVPGSVSNTYHRNAADGRSTATATAFLLLTAGDIIRVRSSASAGITTVADGCRLTIETITG